MKAILYSGSCLLALLTACTDRTRTPDNTLLLNHHYSLPAAWAEKFRNAPVKSFRQTIQFTEPAATACIECTAAVLDPQNSVLTDTKITLLQGASNCTFNASATPEQLNQGTGDEVNTFALATVKYTRRRITSYLEQSKVCTIQSQGAIKTE